MSNPSYQSAPSDSHLVPELLKTLSTSVIVILFCLLLLLRDPEFFWHDDFQVQYLAGFREMARAWSQGEIPLISQSSWFGGALAGEYQYGVFSVFINLVNYLLWQMNRSLPTTAALYSMVHLGVLAAGAFRLARQRHLSTEVAIMVALVTCLNGWMICWGATSWIPGLASFAWVPWVWWSLEFTLRSQQVWRFIPAGWFIYLTLSAGWPFTDLMIALISIWLGLRSMVEQRSLRIIWPLIAAWIMGLGLSAPALLMLIEYNRETVRQGASQTTADWTTPLDSFFGLVLPSYISLWQTGVLKFRRSIELAGGLLPAVFLAISTVRLGKPFIQSRIWDWGLFILCIVLAILPGTGNFRYSFRWLPLLHLVLALLAGEGIDWLRGKAFDQTRWFNNWGIWASLLVLAVWLKGLFLESGNSLPVTTLSLGFKLLLVCLCWAALGKLFKSTSPILQWTPVWITVLSFWLTYTHVSILQAIPHWRIPETVRSPAPFNPSIRYLSLFTPEDAYNGNIFSKTVLEPEPPIQVSPLLQMGNLSMYSGLELINGYSAQQMLGLSVIFKFANLSQMPAQAAFNILTREAGPEGLLQLMGVDGLVVSPRLVPLVPQLLSQGWQAIAEVEGAIMLHRIGNASPRIRAINAVEIRTTKEAILWPLLTHKTSAVPLILLNSSSSQIEGQIVQFAPVSTRIIKESRQKVVVEVNSSSNRAPSLILFSRAWYPGYHARLNGKPVPVSALNLLMPAVELPAGATGELTLEYFPTSLLIGLVVAITALLAVPLSLKCLSIFNEPRLEDN